MRRLVLGRHGKTLIAAILTGGLVVGLGSLTRADPDPATAHLFKSKCALCHGIDGKGDTKPGKKAGVKDWTDGKTLEGMTDAQIAARIHDGFKAPDGKTKMPPQPKLTDAEIHALVTFVRTLEK